MTSIFYLKKVCNYLLGNKSKSDINSISQFIMEAKYIYFMHYLYRERVVVSRGLYYLEWRKENRRDAETSDQDSRLKDQDFSYKPRWENKKNIKRQTQSQNHQMMKKMRSLRNGEDTTHQNTGCYWLEKMTSLSLFL